MKKVLIFLLCLTFIISLTGCKSDKTDLSSYISVNDTVTDVNIVSSINEATTKISSAESSSQIIENTSQEVASSLHYSESSAQSFANSVQSVSSATESVVSEITGYTVNDPQNTRGLSTQKFGFGFGVAENGVANSLSFSNQAKFDEMANIEALALDTKSADKRMYLTFDCGYEYNNLTANILVTLKEKNVKAAFFVTLSYVKNNPQLVRRMIEEGHIVGNHSATHPCFPEISRTEMAEELFLVSSYLEKNFNYKTIYFRFPAGEHSENSLELVTSVGYKSIFWSSAYRDYDTANQNGYDVAYKTVTDRFHQGAVILLHCVSKDNADILGAVIDNAHAQGYSFKTLDDYYAN